MMVLVGNRAQLHHLLKRRGVAKNGEMRRYSNKNMKCGNLKIR